MYKPFSIYISCPIAEPKTVLLQFYNAICAINPGKTKTQYWNRLENYHYKEAIDKCNAFVLILPNNSSNCPVNNLPPGCVRELNQAVAQGRPLYIGYKTTQGEYNTYKAEIIGNNITGMAGTSDFLKDAVQAFDNEPLDVEAVVNTPSVSEVHIPVSVSLHRDVRLLFKKRKK